MQSRRPAPADVVTTLLDVLSLLSALGMPQAKVSAPRAKLETLRTQLAGGSNVGPDVAAALANLETEVTQIAFTVPTAEFRKQLLARKVNGDWLASYARLMTWDSFEDGDRRDRFELVASRVVLKQGEPPFTMAPFEEVSAILSTICRADSGLTEEARKDAVAELTRARENLAAFENLDDLLDKGHYLDVRGYKISLRDRLLDHHVLYAVVHWNSSFLNRIRDLTFAQSRPEYEVDALLRRQADEIDEVFAVSSVDKETATARVNAVKDAVRKSMPEVQRANAQRVKKHAADTRRSRTMVLGVVGMVIALAFVAMFAFRGGGGDLEAMSTYDLGNVSSYLASGAIATGGNVPMFQGQVTAEWKTLPLTQQQRAAENMAEALAEKGIRDGFVTDGGKVVIQFTNGRAKVVSVEADPNATVSERGR